MYSYVLKNVDMENLNKEIKLITFYRGLSEEKKTKFLELIESLEILLDYSIENKKE